MTDTGMLACWDRYRRCSTISAGPVAQLSPIMSMPRGSNAVSAAPMSEPSSMVPVVSMVTWEMIGRRLPAADIPSWQPRTAALTWRRSWLVSIR